MSIRIQLQCLCAKPVLYFYISDLTHLHVKAGFWFSDINSFWHKYIIQTKCTWTKIRFVHPSLLRLFFLNLKSILEGISQCFKYLRYQFPQYNVHMQIAVSSLENVPSYVTQWATIPGRKVARKAVFQKSLKNQRNQRSGEVLIFDFFFFKSIHGCMYGSLGCYQSGSRCSVETER